MKHYVFGDTFKGFIDLLRSIWRMKTDIKHYECSGNEACYNSRQSAEILGISCNASRLYEEWKRTLPFDVFHKMSQSLEICIVK